MPQHPVLVFDVNETLLDLDALTPHFQRIFGRPAALREWFGQLILYSQAMVLCGEYASFDELGGAVLKMLGEIHRCEITADDLKAVKQAVAGMPAHPDAVAALSALRNAGFRMVTLTNNPRATCVEQLERAGLLSFFERQFSIDDNKPPRYKPAVEAYRAVEEGLGVGSAGLCLIACHTWDTLGAAAAGWQSALVLQPGNAPLPVGPQPVIVGGSLTGVARDLIARYEP